jgi:hypothetical protein
MQNRRKDSIMFKRIAIITFAAFGVSLAQMTTFQPNTVAKASEVNANFDCLRKRIDTLMARCDSIALLKTASDGYLPNSNQTWLLAAGQKGISGFDSLPDLRGVFLRGVDYAVTGRNITARDVARESGSFQGDTFFAHSHRVAATSGNSEADLSSPAASGFAGWANNFAGYTSGENSTRIPDRLLIEKSGGTETRPKNVAVYYYIKVK